MDTGNFFISAYSAGEDEGQLHKLAGYGVLGLIVFRVIWRFIGTRYARFWNFICSPKQVLAYSCSLLSGKPIYYIGHNPLGGLIVLALLLSLGLTVWSGLELRRQKAVGYLLRKDRLSNLRTLIITCINVTSMRIGVEEKTHEIFANLTLLLVILHVSGVVLGSVLHRENLVKNDDYGN